jgi:hypothetical protein
MPQRGTRLYDLLTKPDLELDEVANAGVDILDIGVCFFSRCCGLFRLARPCLHASAYLFLYLLNSPTCTALQNHFMGWVSAANSSSPFPVLFLRSSTRWKYMDDVAKFVGVDARRIPKWSRKPHTAKHTAMSDSTRQKLETLYKDVKTMQASLGDMAVFRPRGRPAVTSNTPQQEKEEKEEEEEDEGEEKGNEGEAEVADQEEAAEI